MSLELKPGSGHLEEGDGGPGPVVIRRVERVERVRLRQLVRVERPWVLSGRC